jgi:hypothetical protein
MGGGLYRILFRCEQSGRVFADLFQDVDEKKAIEQAKRTYKDYEFVECTVKQRSHSEIRADRKEFEAKAAKARDDAAMDLLTQQSEREAKKSSRKKKSK